MKQLISICIFMLFCNISSATGILTSSLENPGYLDKPEWFKNSFLDIREDLDEANEENKRLILYFHQDGCPYCEKLINDNFTNNIIVKKTQQSFDVIAINMWGDKEVIDFKGSVSTEKSFAKLLKVQYTPTMLMLDEKGDVVLRINGYYHPDKFKTALNYVAAKLENKVSYRDYRSKNTKTINPYVINTADNNVVNVKNLNLSAKNGKPFLVIFEDTICKNCNELHNDILQRPLSKTLLSQLNVLTFDMWSNDQIITPKGELTTWAKWSKLLDIKYSPGMVLFDNKGKEIIRTEGYLRSFHIQSVLDYVISNAYKHEPELQRFIEDRADAIRAKGQIVDIMN